MSSFKNFIKQQGIFSTRSKTESASVLKSETREDRDVQKNLAYRQNSETSVKIHEEISLLEKKQRRQRSRTIGAGFTEDILKCRICKERFKSPKTMPCQHTVCLQCLNRPAFFDDKEISLRCPLCQFKVMNITPERLPTNPQIETFMKISGSLNENARKEKAMSVSFADLPRKSVVDEIVKCHVCDVICKVEKKCGHCRHVFCANCWSIHANNLRGRLKDLKEELDTISEKSADRINVFKNKVDEVRTSINKEVDQKISELMQQREENLKKTDEMLASGETVVEEIQSKISKTRDEIVREKEICDSSLDEERKVKTYLTFQQKVAELAATISALELELPPIELSMGTSTKRRSLVLKSKENPIVSYKHKMLMPVTIACRDTVQNPSCLALDPSRDHVLVACPALGQVVVLDRKYKLLRRIYHQDMMAPQGVAFLEETEEIFVTDKWKHCIVVFNRRGEFQRSFCTKGSGISQLRSPEGLAFDPTGNQLYVADTGNDRVLILTKNGEHLGNIGPRKQYSTRTGETTRIIVNELNQPTDVAVSSTCVIVADCGNHKIKIFRHDGEILRSYGSLGALRGFFKSPQVVCVDKEGNVIVGDAGNGRVQIFSADGELLRILGEKGSKFRWVSGVLVKDNCSVLVADSKNNTIQLF